MARYSIFVWMGIFLLVNVGWGSCPLDHLLIGCNRDGTWGTVDDQQLFVECGQKYRHSDPAHNGDPTWLNWFYPLYYNAREDVYVIGEPGFDVFQSQRPSELLSYDPNRCLVGIADVDYRIMIQCVGISEGFKALNSGVGVVLDEVGDEFNHSQLSDPHLHLQYRASGAMGGEGLYWITYWIYDALSFYEASLLVTVVFGREGLDGDLVVDGVVNETDMVAMAGYWLADDGGRWNDFYERADVNRDGRVDMVDFGALAGNWLAVLADK